jgi:hypothetical protein
MGTPRNDQREIPEREPDITLVSEDSTRGVSIWIYENLFKFEGTDFCWTDICAPRLGLETVKDPMLYLKKVGEYTQNPIRAKAAQCFLDELDSILVGS